MGDRLAEATSPSKGKEGVEAEEEAAGGTSYDTLLKRCEEAISVPSWFSVSTRSGSHETILGASSVHMHSLRTHALSPY